MGTRRRLTGDGREGILTCAHCLESPVRHHGRFTGERAGLGEAPAPRVHGRPARGTGGARPRVFRLRKSTSRGLVLQPDVLKVRPLNSGRKEGPFKPFRGARKVETVSR